MARRGRGTVAGAAAGDAANPKSEGASLDPPVLLPDGSEFIRDTLSMEIRRGDASQASDLGRELAERLLSAGARDLLSRSEAMNG